MGKIPNELRETIARNIRDCRMKKFPGRGGGKKCAEAFGVSPQQWSPWERGMRTPDELRLSQIAEFFGVTVEYLRRDNTVRKPEALPGAEYTRYPAATYSDYSHPQVQPLRDSDAPPYGIPPLRRDETVATGTSVTELAMVSARLMGMIGSTTKGVVEGRLDIGNAIIVLRRLGDILEQRLREAEPHMGGMQSSH